jgi:hypothetical protein
MYASDLGARPPASGEEERLEEAEIILAGRDEGIEDREDLSETAFHNGTEY